MRKISAIAVYVILTASVLYSTVKANFLWKVSGADGKEKVYLLGSIHIVPDDVYPLSKKINDAYESSGFVVVEADVNSIDQAEIQKLMIEKGMYSDGGSLSDDLNEDQVKKLEKALKKTGILGFEQVKMMKPWLIALTVPQLIILKSGLKADNGIDMHFLKKASKDKKRILELESADFQLDLLSSFSDDLQIKFLESTLDELDTFKEEYDSMVKAWKDDNVAKMEKIVNDEYDENPGLKDIYRKLVYDRNVSMTSKIDGYMKDKRKDKFFVIVGAAHLIDKDGIVKMLEKKGYKVQKM
ncbi:MAG TPA: TraB/GumN family protein [Clostridiales bacterium]|nr:TraB/GumN family protein [Clostridiales bacterium]HQP70738.1 TraB/GumN family protein [Clostridiales bacterium]